MDATNKWEGETDREWGTSIQMDTDVKEKVDAMWDSLGIHLPGRTP
jgi:4-hydroxy-3-polyprenylbenzoate decarboxylase